MFQTLTVHLGERSYPIYTANGALRELGAFLNKELAAARYALISDSNVAALYGEQAQQALKAAGLQAELFSFPAGEAHKRLTTIEALASAMAGAGFDRKSAIIALGGGVSGDLGGFLAATYMRGIPFAQVPTSLLAQVDSSVGGKTGVDLAEGKNLLGAFHQPRLVLIDPELLLSLPEREFLSGMAEVIKYGVSLDASFFTWLGKQRRQVLARDGATLATLARRCCALKAQIVEQDERESGLRRVLNFGHTIGHAVEAASDFTLPHGFAVAIGMCAVARLAVLCGYAKASLPREIAALLSAYGLPVCAPAGLARERLEAFLLTDKKAISGRLFFVLPETLGRVRITDEVDKEALQQALSGC